MVNYLRILILAVFILAGLYPVAELNALPVEPNIADYSKVPVFSSLKTPPNIMVIFDNSGSMNHNAYGLPTDNFAIRNDIYVPLYSKETTISYDVVSGNGDAEEYIASGLTYDNGLDLDLGRTGPDRLPSRVLHNIVGLRFEDIALNPSAEIVTAYLEMEAAPTRASALTEPLSLVINADPTPTALPYASTYGNITDRDNTQSEQFWTHDNTVDPWLVGNIYRIPNLTNVVQEVINHPAWVNGSNAINLKLTYGVHSPTAQRNIVSFEGWRHDPTASRPRLNITFKSETGTRYYGNFNSDWIYTSDTKDFTHKYKKISYLDSSQYDMADPIELADWNALVAKSGCGDGQWWVRYPASYSSPNPVEATWATKCLSDADFNTEGLWDGNWMNWASTRRIDVARKVLTGGLGAKNGLGNPTLSGENSAQSSRTWTVRYDSTAAGNHATTPYLVQTDYQMDRSNGGTVGFMNDGSTDHDLVVVQSPYFDPDSFTADGKLGGILQTFWEDAYWGLTFFESSYSGGEIAYTTQEHPTNANYMAAINTVEAKTWTPLSETLYTAMQYFKQEQAETGLGYKNNGIQVNPTSDPFIRKNRNVNCIKNFVLLVTDGASTKDSEVPSWLKDPAGGDGDGDGDASCSGDGSCVTSYEGLPVADYGGSDYLDDIALYAHTTDLRPPVTTTVGGVPVTVDDLEGNQTIDIYTVYAAFGADKTSGDYHFARNLLIDTAINGGFEDQDGDGKPSFTDSNNDGDWDPGECTIVGDVNSCSEFDRDGDSLPDNYFEASNGAELKSKLAAAIASILAKSASGTAVSVLATSSEGEGTLVQAYFKPKSTGDADGITEMMWAGYLQAFWVDSYGNLREDTVNDLKLNESEDKIISFAVESGDTKVRKFTVSAANQFPDTDITVNSDYTTSAIDTAVPVWEAGRALANITADPDPGVPYRRRIFTYTDGSISDLYGGVKFDLTNVNHLRPYFGVYDDNTWRHLGPTINDRSLNLINYMRGYDSGFSGWTSTRNRTILVDNLYKVWKLGDIVNSTPVTIQQPPDAYDLIYADRGYSEYKKDKIVRWDSGTLKGWETMVYVGANDGMLHAFTGWKYDKTKKTFKQPGTPDADGNMVSGTFILGEDIGSEVWAYIPRALLPHLKWYPDPNYIHTYYVDLRPKVVDIRVFNPDPVDHINGWGTVLIGGLRLGGKEIDVEEDFGSGREVKTFFSSYFAIDITDPRNPELMWERTYDDIGLTTSDPAVLKVGDQPDDKWYLIFGSGPNDPADKTSQGAYEGVSSRPGRVYVVNALTGEPVKANVGDPDYLFSTAETNSFMAGAASIDKFLNFNVDATYIGATHTGTNPESGSMYKITVPWRCNGTCTGYGDTDNGEFVRDPVDGANPWTFNKIFDSPGPVTAPPSLSIDTKQNTWVYFGTGRYLSLDDKTTVDDQYLFGIKDPFFNSTAVTTTNPACCTSDPSCDTTCGYNDYAADYYLDYSNNLTLDISRLFDGDTFKVFFPWTANPSPAGDPLTCISGNNPLYKIGDISATGDDSCIAYEYICTDTVVGGCATGPITTGDLGPAGDGDIDFDSSGVGDGLCECRLDDAIRSDWGVVATSGNISDCADVGQGELGDVYGDNLCIGMYWSAVGATDTSCNGVSFGDVVVNGGTDTTCNSTSNVGPAPAYTVDLAQVPEIYYFVRPDPGTPGVDGVCDNIDQHYVGSLYNDPLLAPYDSYCLATYWTCKEDGDDPSGDCDATYADGTPAANIDFHAKSNVNAPALSKDNDGDGDLDCICSFSQEPVAHAKDGVFGSAIDQDPFLDDGVTPNPNYKKPYDFFSILEFARMKDGWFRPLSTPGERSITKPGLIGGISLFTSYIPNEEECSYGGDSYLYALYYETGTAYRERVIGWEIDAAGDLVASDRMLLGTGLASSVGLHIGLQEENTATGFVQQSTGAITKLRIDPAFQIRSGLTSWRDN